MQGDDDARPQLKVELRRQRFISATLAVALSIALVCPRLREAVPEVGVTQLQGRLLGEERAVPEVGVTQLQGRLLGEERVLEEEATPAERPVETAGRVVAVSQLPIAPTAPPAAGPAERGTVSAITSYQPPSRGQALKSVPGWVECTDVQRAIATDLGGRSEGAGGCEVVDLGKYLCEGATSGDVEVHLDYFAETDIPILKNKSFTISGNEYISPPYGFHPFGQYFGLTNMRNKCDCPELGCDGPVCRENRCKNADGYVSFMEPCETYLIDCKMSWADCNRKEERGASPPKRCQVYTTGKRLPGTMPYEQNPCGDGIERSRCSCTAAATVKPYVCTNTLGDAEQSNTYCTPDALKYGSIVDVQICIDNDSLLPSRCDTSSRNEPIPARDADAGGPRPPSAPRSSPGDTAPSIPARDADAGGPRPPSAPRSSPGDTAPSCYDAVHVDAELVNQSEIIVYLTATQIPADLSYQPASYQGVLEVLNISTRRDVTVVNLLGSDGANKVPNLGSDGTIRLKVNGSIQTFQSGLSSINGGIVLPPYESMGSICLADIRARVIGYPDESKLWNHTVTNPNFQPLGPRFPETKGAFFIGAQAVADAVEVTDPKCLPGVAGGAQGFSIAVVVGQDPINPHSPPTPPPPPAIEKDPHLHFAHGGRADFRGKHGQYYSFFSAPGLAVNLKPEDATFELRQNDGATLTVEGSFITEAHVVARVGPPDRPAWANFSFWASELTENNWGYKVINGTCDGRRVRIGKGKSKRCEELTVSVHMSTASFEAGNWTVTVKASPVYNLIAGPEHRLDIGFRVKGDYAARFLPHGIFGQSFSSTEPRHGKVDAYPHSGHFRTTAMAEGAIEGEAAQYEVGSPYATRFVYSRFETTPQQGDWPQHVLLAGDQDGSVGRRRRRRQRIRV